MIGTTSSGSTYIPYTGAAGMQSGCLNANVIQQTRVCS